MTPMRMTTDEISNLCKELLWYKRPRQEYFAAEMGLEPKILLRCKLPTTSKSFRLISPHELAHLIELNVQHILETASCMSNSMRHWRKGFDVLDASMEFVSHHTFHSQALQMADSVHGVVRSVGRDPIPTLTPEQLLRHRWRKAIYARDDWDLDDLSKATGYCPHSLVRLGYEHPKIGLTPSPEAVEAIEALVAREQRIAA